MFPAFQNTLYGGLLNDPEIAVLLSAEEEIRGMIDVERALARAQARVGVIPQDAADAIDAGLADFTICPFDLAPGTAKTGVPVPPLVDALRGALPDEAAHWVHWGATTQDIMDCALVLRLAAVLDVIEARLLALINRLADMAEAHADLPMAGRTRSQIATPITFGLRVAQWLQPLLDLRDRLPGLRASLSRVQCGGASGANSAIAPHGQAVTEALAEELGLTPSPPWHTNRVALTDLAGWCAGLAGATARMAGDAMVMLRREVAELSLSGGGGSSTMPNKTNPVAAEAVVALGRFTAGVMGGATQALHHQEERDATAWMLEWMVLPQMLVATGSSLRNTGVLLENLSPVPDQMARALELDGGAVHAEALSFALARHMPKASAKDLVGKAALQARDDGRTLTKVLADMLPEGVPSDALNTDGSGQEAQSIVAEIITRARAGTKGGA